MELHKLPFLNDALARCKQNAAGTENKSDEVNSEREWGLDNAILAIYLGKALNPQLNLNFEPYWFIETLPPTDACKSTVDRQYENAILVSYTELTAFRCPFHALLLHNLPSPRLIPSFHL